VGAETFSLGRNKATCSIKIEPVGGFSYQYSLEVKYSKRLSEHNYSISTFAYTLQMLIELLYSTINNYLFVFLLRTSQNSIFIFERFSSLRKVLRKEDQKKDRFTGGKGPLAKMQYEKLHRI
jgi:hypothetical protein